MGGRTRIVIACVIVSTLPLCATRADDAYSPSTAAVDAASPSAVPNDVGPAKAPDGESTVPDDQTLQATGAVIGDITIHAGEIFDTENPDEDGKVLRAANKLHVNTRVRVIRRQLTFSEGDRYSRAALDESERILRHSGYLYDAKIRGTSYDGHRVNIGVWTRDVWTLRPSIGLHRSGGANTVHFGIHDANFLGLGKSVEIEQVNGVDRTQTMFLYSDPAIIGTHARLAAGYSSNSDGSSMKLAVERPFWRREENWATGVRGETNDRTDSLYALGSVVHQFDESYTYLGGYAGWRVGRSTHTVKRLLAGLTYDRSLFTPLIPGDTLSPLPADRELAYPWFGINISRDGYIQAHDLDKIGRTEDVNLALDMTAKVGFAAPAFGADRTAGIFDFSWHNGLSPGNGQILTLDAGAGGRLTSGGLEDARMDLSARYYHRDSDVRLFFISLAGTASANLDLDHQVLLGGDNGLRGYPLRYATGDKSLLLNVEERFFFNREFFHVMRLGGAIFGDIGKAWAEDPGPASHLGVLKDIGIGLRFGQTRSAHAAMVRIDLAVPFDMPGSGLKPQFLVTTGETF